MASPWNLGIPAALRAKLRTTLCELGPYAAIALVLPGGSLIALAVWTFRHRPRAIASLSRVLVTVAAFGAALILPGSI